MTRSRDEVIGSLLDLEQGRVNNVHDAPASLAGGRGWGCSGFFAIVLEVGVHDVFQLIEHSTGRTSKS